MVETGGGYRRPRGHHDGLRDTVEEDVQVSHLDEPSRVALIHWQAGGGIINLLQTDWSWDCPPGERPGYSRGEDGPGEVWTSSTDIDRLRQVRDHSEADGHQQLPPQAQDQVWFCRWEDWTIIIKINLKQCLSYPLILITNYWQIWLTQDFLFSTKNISRVPAGQGRGVAGRRDVRDLPVLWATPSSDGLMMTCPSVLGAGREGATSPIMPRRFGYE